MRVATPSRTFTLIDGLLIPDLFAMAFVARGPTASLSGTIGVRSGLLTTGGGFAPGLMSAGTGGGGGFSDRACWGAAEAFTFRRLTTCVTPGVWAIR